MAHYDDIGIDDMTAACRRKRCRAIIALLIRAAQRTMLADILSWLRGDSIWLRRRGMADAFTSGGAF